MKIFYLNSIASRLYQLFVERGYVWVSYISSRDKQKIRTFHTIKAMPFFLNPKQTYDVLLEIMSAREGCSQTEYFSSIKG